MAGYDTQARTRARKASFHSDYTRPKATTTVPLPSWCMACQNCADSTFGVVVSFELRKRHDEVRSGTEV
jgi:hypothetical protein